MPTASLVLGIISIVIALWTMGLFAPVSLVLGILAIIFGLNGRKDELYGRTATAGMVCGIVGTVLTVLTGFWWFWLGYGLWSLFWWF